MGTILQLCLGTVYSWSYFQKPLVECFKGMGYTNTHIAWAFSLAICFLGLAASAGGILLPRTGPRKLAIIGGILFGLGYIIASFAVRFKLLWLLYSGYGVIGGIGLGLGYVTPVATVAKWFPDRKGLVTGMVVMGFGFGALLMSKFIAPILMRQAEGDLTLVFLWLGFFFLPATIFVAYFLQNPPSGYIPSGWMPPVISSVNAQQDDNSSALSGIFSLKFAMMWIVFFCNITAGIAIISFQSPLFQDLLNTLDGSIPREKLAVYGATLIAVSSLFNGIGRIFWGGVSDRIGRVQVFMLVLATQVAAFLTLPEISNPWIFGAIICYVLLCYGGGFGTMPSFVLDEFGSKSMAVTYGTILTAWSAAGIVGPQLVAYCADNYGKAASLYTFRASAVLLFAGLSLSIILYYFGKRKHLD